MVKVYDNSDGYPYDCALGGIPLVFARKQNREPFYQRATQDNKKEQIDTSNQPGDNSFSGFWTQSQTSWHLGLGITYQDINVPYRYYDSHGIDAAQLDQVSNQHAMTNIHTDDSPTWKVIGFSISGTDGILWQYDGGVKTSGLAGTSPNTLGSFSGTILDIASTGSQYLVLTTTGVYAGDLPSGTAVKMYEFNTAITRGIIGWAKGRAIVVGNTDIYALPLRGDTDSNKLDPNHDTWVAAGPNTSLVYTSISEGPRGIYLSSYAGLNSTLDLMTLGDDNTIAPPITIAQTSAGEIITTTTVAYGTILAMGTNKGLYICYIQGDGSIARRSATISTVNSPITSILALGDFIWCTSATSSEFDGTKHSAIYKIDLRYPVDENNLVYAYHKSMFSPEDYDTDKLITSITTGGFSNRIVFAQAGYGIFIESTTAYVDGWIKTGKLRFNTTEEKVYHALSIGTNATDETDSGIVKAYWLDETDTLNDVPLINNNPTEASTVKDQPGSDWIKHSYISYVFTLDVSDDNTKYPIFNFWQVKANPSNVKQKQMTIIVDLYKNKKADGSYLIIEEDSLSIINQLENMRDYGSAVAYQDFRSSESYLVIIDDVQLTQTGTATGGGNETDRLTVQGLATIQFHVINNANDGDDNGGEEPEPTDWFSTTIITDSEYWDYSQVSETIIGDEITWSSGVYTSVTSIIPIDYNTIDNSIYGKRFTVKSKTSQDHIWFGLGLSTLTPTQMKTADPKNNSMISILWSTSLTGFYYGGWNATSWTVSNSGTSGITANTYYDVSFKLIDNGSTMNIDIYVNNVLKTTITNQTKLPDNSEFKFILGGGGGNNTYKGTVIVD